MFGGYNEGESKSSGLQGSPSGWRVLGISGEGSSGAVTLVSAGCPVLGYYAHTYEDKDVMLNNMSDFGREFTSEHTVGNGFPLDHVITEFEDNCGIDYWIAHCDHGAYEESWYGYLWKSDGSSLEYDNIGWWYDYSRKVDAMLSGGDGKGGNMRSQGIGGGGAWDKNYSVRVSSSKNYVDWISPVLNGKTTAIHSGDGMMNGGRNRVAGIRMCITTKPGIVAVNSDDSNAWKIRRLKMYRLI